MLQCDIADLHSKRFGDREQIGSSPLRQRGVVMPNKQDRDYFLRREAQERPAAMKTAGSGSVIHTELANRYARLIDDSQPGAGEMPER